jgi:hypothetical protein
MTLPNMADLVGNRPPLVEGVLRPFAIKRALDNPRRYDIFHPSAWGSCLRKMAYQYYNEQEHFADKKGIDVDCRMQRVFDNGHSVHERWQNYLDDAGILRGWWKCPNPLCGKTYGEENPIGIFNPLRTVPDFHCECGNNKKLRYEEVLVKSEECYNFEGHCDAVVDLSNNPQKRNNQFDVFVVDFKSMKDEYFGELVEAKHEHVVQVHIYMWLLNIQSAVVLYENKDNQALKECFVPRDEELIEKIKQQAIWLRGKLQNRELPFKPAGYSRTKFPCGWCEFRSLCYQ